MSVDVVLASACLPYLFHAVEIDGEHYWDGGFMGNPAIFPLIYNRGSKDVILVHINPIERKKLPKTAAEIFNRMDEISFNSSLMREMRAVAFVTKLIDDNVLDRGKYSRMLIHSIRDDAAMAELRSCDQAQSRLGLPVPAARQRSRQDGRVAGLQFRQGRAIVDGRSGRDLFLGTAARPAPAPA